MQIVTWGMDKSFKKQPLSFLYVLTICGFDLTTDTPACLSPFFLSYWMTPHFSGIMSLLCFKSRLVLSNSFHSSHSHVLPFYCTFFIIWYFIIEHFTLLLRCTVSQSRLTVLLLVTGECGGWDVIGWGPYGKHSWYLLSSLLLGNFWESFSTRGKKMFPFPFSFLLKYFFLFTVLYIQDLLKYIVLSFNTQVLRNNVA